MKITEGEDNGIYTCLCECYYDGISHKLTRLVSKNNNEYTKFATDDHELQWMWISMKSKAKADTIKSMEKRIDLLKNIKNQ